MATPKLRFKEFDGDWIFTNIQSLVDLKIIDKPMDGNHGEIHPTSVDYVEDGIPFVMATDVFDGTVHLERSKKITKKQADSLRKGFSLEGDILLTHKATIGNVAKVPKLLTPYIMLTPQVTYYRVSDKERMCPDYIKSYFQSNFFQNELVLLCTGATRLYIGISEQRKLPFSYPSKPEQTKIATFLSAVDDKIQQLTKKHELLSQYKQGMMQKLFSQQIRFKADDGSEFKAWEEKMLGEVSQINPKAKDLPEKFIYIDLESVEKGQLLLKKDILLNTAPSRAQRLLQRRDVLFQTVRPYQQNNYYFDLDGDYVASTGYAQIRTTFDSKFIFYALHEKRFLDEVLNRCTGTSFPAINATDLSSIKILFPSLAEQTKIADFLSAIDQKIEGVNKQLEQAKTWKKGLLQQMFV